MRSIIRDSVILAAPAEDLYAAYLDSARHAEITGAPVTIGAESGSLFTAFHGNITGTTLAVIPSKLVVQSWRSTNFHPGDSDSTLILAFVPEGKDGRIDLVHLDVPAVDYQAVTAGWETYYWAPWRRYLAKAAGA